MRHAKTLIALFLAILFLTACSFSLQKEKKYEVNGAHDIASFKIPLDAGNFKIEDEYPVPSLRGSSLGKNFSTQELKKPPRVIKVDS